MVSVVLYQPEIPPNTGNVMRLCANTGASLHLVEPLGFSLDDRYLRRAGMDYRDLACVRVHAGLDDVLAAHPGCRVLAASTRGRKGYTEVRFREDDLLLFGPETRGLPASVLEALPAEHRLRIPMRPGCRSLNLSNAVAVVVFEAWRQLGFPGADTG